MIELGARPSGQSVYPTNDSVAELLVALEESHASVELLRSFDVLQSGQRVRRLPGEFVGVMAPRTDITRRKGSCLEVV